MVRSLSRGRAFDRSPILDSSDSSYHGHHNHHHSHSAMKKSSYNNMTRSGGVGRGIELYATPPRSELRSTSRGRYGGGGDSYGVDDHRNPMSDGRFGGGGRSSSLRDRFDDNDIMDDMSHTESRPLRNLGRSFSAASPRLRRHNNTTNIMLDDMDDDDDMMYENVTGGGGASKYEILGMKEEIKKKDNETSALRREMDGMSLKYEDNMSSVRSKLVANFKEDMQEMKAQWEDAFQRLKEESDATQRALEVELTEATSTKSEMEKEVNELKSEFRTQIEEEKARSQSRMEELKRSKEEDLERLRSMYESHLDSTKKSASDVESELKDEIHMLLEENEKVKLCYDNLENEMARCKSDLEELSANYQKALNENLQWEKDATSYKEELDDVCDENNQRARMNKQFEEELLTVKGELERTTSQYQRVTAEKTRFEKEYNAAAKDRDEASAGYNDLVQKLDDIQEERTLESRYTEALVKQRDNMNGIIETSQQEIEELKTMNTELNGVNTAFIGLVKEFHLSDSSSPVTSVREELSKCNKMKERLDTLGRERERYNATVKALKVDLKALHGENVGVETSLQEHMRLLNDKWESNETRSEQVDTLKSELEDSIRLLEENAKEREKMMKDYHDRVTSIETELQENQTALVKMEREKMKMENELSNYDVSASKMTRLQEELEAKCAKLQDQCMDSDEQLRKSEAQCKSLHSNNQSLHEDVDKIRAKKNELEDALDKVEDVKKGLKKKLEASYYGSEEATRELSSVRQAHETVLSKLSMQKNIISTQEEEIKSLKSAQFNQAQVVENAQNEVAQSYKAQLGRMEEKYEEKLANEITQLRERNKTLEAAMKDQKESLDQKSMVEIKRRGEFAKQKQELEILRSKERHLETHVNQLEEHISKVVADYEAKLQNSNQTVCTTDDSETKMLNKRVRELEKKLEVSSAAMKQIGKSSLLMEKENERLKNDKNELKLKLSKLVSCAEKFQG